MILQPRTRSVPRRSAFTLLEVLVVVAIILVLASVATVAVLNMLKENKTDAAKINAISLEKSHQNVHHQERRQPAAGASRTSCGTSAATTRTS